MVAKGAKRILWPASVLGFGDLGSSKPTIAGESGAGFIKMDFDALLRARRAAIVALGGELSLNASIEGEYILVCLLGSATGFGETLMGARS